MWPFVGKVCARIRLLHTEGVEDVDIELRGQMRGHRCYVCAVWGVALKVFFVPPNAV